MIDKACKRLWTSKHVRMENITQWLSVREAANILGVSTQRVYQLIKEGKLTPYKLPINGETRISADELNAATAPVMKRDG